MFDFESFEREIEEQNAALESMLLEMEGEVAEEGLFSKPKSADDMLAKVEKSVNKKCKTVEACDDFLAKLKEEESKFNSALKTMKAAAIKFQKDNDKKALKEAIKPAKAELAKTCSIISLKDVGSADNITDEEIKKLKAFLTGARKIVTDKKKELKNASKATESFDLFDLDTVEDGVEPATEALEKLKVQMRKAAIAIVTKLRDFCSKRFKKTNDSNHDKKANFWYKKLMTLNGWLQSLKSANEKDAEVIKNKAEKMKEECEEKAKEEDAAGNNSGDATTESFILKSFDLACQEFDLACEEYNSIVGVATESFFSLLNEDDEETAEEAAFIAGYNSAMEAMQNAQIDQDIADLDILLADF